MPIRSLLIFPAELIMLVSRELPSKDFRQTCRQINEKSAPVLIERFFQTRYLMIEHRSPANLVQVSRHPIFGPAVRALEICTDNLLPIEDIPNLERLRPADHPRRYARRRSWNTDIIAGHDAPSDTGPAVDRTAYLLHLEDQQQLAELGLDVAYLTAAMTNLRNCRIITLDDNTRPWGCFTLARELGVMPCRDMEFTMLDSIEFVQRMIRSVFTALVASEMQLQEIHIQFGFLNDAGSCVTADLLALPGLLQRDIRSRLTNVSSLNLIISGEELLVSRMDLRPHKWENDFMCFVGLFPELSRLSLAFARRDEHQRSPFLCAELYIPHLASLQLDFMDCTEGELIQLLVRHKSTLRSITLHSIDIIDTEGSWCSVVRTIRDELTINE